MSKFTFHLCVVFVLLTLNTLEITGSERKVSLSATCYMKLTEFKETLVGWMKDSKKNVTSRFRSAEDLTREIIGKIDHSRLEFMASLSSRIKSDFEAKRAVNSKLMHQARSNNTERCNYVFFDLMRAEYKVTDTLDECGTRLENAVIQYYQILPRILFAKNMELDEFIAEADCNVEQVKNFESCVNTALCLEVVYRKYDDTVDVNLVIDQIVQGAKAMVPDVTEHLRSCMAETDLQYYTMSRTFENDLRTCLNLETVPAADQTETFDDPSG